MYKKPLSLPNEKTKVLFAFGRHGNSDGKKADSAFFKGAVEPFLERHVVQEGRSAKIIHECILYDFFTLVPGRMDSVIKLMHGPASRSASRRLKEMLGWIRQNQEYLKKAAEQNYRAADYGAEISQVHRWGFEEKVVEINSKTPGLVRSVPEHQEPRNIIAVFDEVITGEFFSSIADDQKIDKGFKIRILAEMIRKGGLADRLRDQTVLDQIVALARYDPQTVIIVPRGFLHFPMASMLDRKKFDVEIRYGTRGIRESEEAWRIKAIANHYQGRLDERQLRDFLEANYDWEKRATRHQAGEKRGKG